MSSRTRKPKRREVPSWIYNWRSSGRHLLRSSLAFLIAAGCFAVFLVAVRVRVVRPVTWAAPQASLIQVDDSLSGRMLARRAREEGPFPSRFSLAEWGELPAWESKLQEATRSAPERYVPGLRGFADVAGGRSGLASRGEPVLPTRPLASISSPQVRPLVMVPRLRPISGIRAADLPSQLPDFKLQPGDTLAAQTWNFLIRLDRRGRVADCVSMAGDEALEPTAIEGWLRRIAFHEAPEAAERWIAVGVGFENQASNDGTDAD